MTFADLRYAVAAGVATITLVRPEKLNAARVGTLDELIAALDAADVDDAVRVVVVTGSGRAFCAGTDLANGFGDLPMGGDAATGEGVGADVGGLVTLRLFAMNKPVLAAVNGVAAGFGATVLLAMDRRIAVTGARFVFPFTRRGIVAESCSSWFLPRLVGISTALDWMLSGRVIEAEEALDKGLVDELVAPEALLPRVAAIAEEIATHAAPASVAFTRRLLWQMLGADDPRLAHDYESRALAALLAHPDAKEGVQSFLERRPPAFSSTTADAAAVLRRWWSD